MALPALPPRLKSALRPLKVAGTALGPTGIGVLLSLGAHAGLIAASVQNGGAGGNLFGAFDEAAAEAAEERSVPIVQLTPAERDRLPAFAQPRRDPLSSSSLSSLALPPGLPVPSNLTQPRKLPTRANSMPSTTPRQQTRASSIQDIKKLFPDLPVTAAPPPPPTSLNLRLRPSASDYLQAKPPVEVPPIEENQTAVESGTEIESPNPDNSGLQQLEGLTNAEALARLEGIGELPISPAPTQPDDSNNNSQPPEAPPESEGNSIPIRVENTPEEVPTLALNPANGDPADLLDELTYDDTLVSETAVIAKVDNWSETVVADRGPLPTGTSEVGIKAAFKACRETPPQDALIGVVVNPDGALEDLDVLQSTGYETLNLRAREAVENHDFGEVTQPTRYQVTVKVDYDEAGCVDVEGLKERLNAD